MYATFFPCAPDWVLPPAKTAPVAATSKKNTIIFFNILSSWKKYFFTPSTGAKFPVHRFRTIGLFRNPGFCRTKGSPTNRLKDGKNVDFVEKSAFLGDLFENQPGYRTSPMS
jgi:hypothetical protein